MSVGGREPGKAERAVGQMSEKPESNKVRVVSATLTEAEYADLVALASARCESRSEAIRSCILAVVKRAKKKGIWDK